MNKLTLITLIIGLVFPGTIAIAQSDPLPDSKPAANPTNTEEKTAETSPTDAKDMTAEAKSFVFNFDNAFDYSSCMDIILLAHEGRIDDLEQAKQNECSSDILTTFGTDISQKLARQLIESANIHATEKLEDALYPVLGVRRRVAINLGYIYEIDTKNQDVLQLISDRK